MSLLLAEDPNPLGHVLDVTLIAAPDGTPLITMHMLTLVLAFLALVWVMMTAAKAIETGPESEGNDRYLTSGRIGQMVEVLTLALRDKVIEPVLGSATNKYLPYLLTLFFFVLLNNLLGLVPLLDLQHIAGALFMGDSHWAVVGGTATGNLAVTAGLALISFIVIQVHGLRELGVGGWVHHLLGGAPAYLAPIMVPVELLGMLIKPGALAIRLFANMMAGHTLMATLALFGLMALNGIGTWIAALGISFIAGAFAVAISFLELFVAFLQAFIFMFLTAVFIGQLSHHDDHHEEHAGHAEAAHA
jgi:F-type H+-transporting ATPase subunit a